MHQHFCGYLCKYLFFHPISSCFNKNVSGVTSKKTGFNPNKQTASTVETKVNVGTKTSSSFLIPKATKAKCKATVPLQTEIAYLVLI